MRNSFPWIYTLAILMQNYANHEIDKRRGVGQVDGVAGGNADNQGNVGDVRIGVVFVVGCPTADYVADGVQAVVFVIRQKQFRAGADSMLGRVELFKSLVLRRLNLALPRVVADSDVRRVV